MTIRLVVLGSGGSVPSPERNVCSIAMRYEGDVYLFDCGEGTQRQMMKYGISYAKVKAIFVSHLHGDHIFGIPGLLHTLRMIERKEKLFIFGPAGTAKKLTEMLTDRSDILEIKDIDERWKYDIGEAEFSAFQVDHGMRALGYAFREKSMKRFDKEKCAKLGIKGRMFKTLEQNGEVKVKDKTVKTEDVTYGKEGKTIIFSGDTAYSPETVRASIGADVLFHDATFMEVERKQADEVRHATVLDAARVAKEAGVKKLVVFHISNRYKDPKEIEKEGKKEFENLTVASDGMEILV